MEIQPCSEQRAHTLQSFPLESRRKEWQSQGTGNMALEQLVGVWRRKILQSHHVHGDSGLPRSESH